MTPAGERLRGIDEIAVARTTDRALHLIWARAEGAGGSIVHRALAPDLRTLSGPDLVAGYAGPVNHRLDLLATSGGLRALFAGRWPGSAVDGVLATSTSIDGRSWSAAAAVSSTGAGTTSPVHVAAGIAGAVGLDGRLYGLWGAPGQGLHVGASSADPDTPLPGGGADAPGAGIDSQSGQVVAAWNLVDEDGVAVMPLSPAGPRIVIPGSGAPQLVHPVSVSGRPRAPGVFVAYSAGRSEFLGRPAIYRVGTVRGRVLSKANGALQTSLAPAAGGRIWAFWHRDGRLYARRSDPDVTAWGATVSLAPPRGKDEIEGIAADATLGPLDLVARLADGGGVAGWHRRVLPGLTLAAQRGRHGRVTFQVLDAGDPVAGARVRVKGARTRTTGAGGSAVFTLERGRHLATAVKRGYASASVGVRVR